MKIILSSYDYHNMLIIWASHTACKYIFPNCIIYLSNLQNIFVKTAKCICPNSEFICRNCKMYLSKFRLGSNHERPTRLVKGKSLLMSSSFGFTERGTAFTAIAWQIILKKTREYKRIANNTEEYSRIQENCKKHWKILKNSRELQRIPANCKEYWRIGKNTRDYWGIYSNTRDTRDNCHFAKKLHPMHIRYQRALKWDL